MKRILIILCLIVFLGLCVSGCAKYAPKDFLGLTSDQIEKQFGAFDLAGVSFISTDSTYRGFGSGYIIKERQVGFLGTTPAEYFFIVFDENGIAVGCYEGYHCDGG